jgi:hypothetical protein
MIVWGLLAACIDTVFRGLFLAYMTSIVKAYVFVILFAYWLMIVITICISKRELFLWTPEYFDAWTSFVFSAYEDSNANYNFRSRSKGTFSFLFVVSLAFVFVSTNTQALSGIGFALKTGQFEMVDCVNICTIKDEDLVQCNEKWKYLPQSQHQLIQIVLCCLFGLSILEWLLESRFDFMPYPKFYKGTECIYHQGSKNEDFEPGDSENGQLPLALLSPQQSPLPPPSTRSLGTQTQQSTRRATL